VEYEAIAVCSREEYYVDTKVEHAYDENKLIGYISTVGSGNGALTSSGAHAFSTWISPGSMRLHKIWK
jgi:hypothetical protein